jgi:hypothetical protein
MLYFILAFLLIGAVAVAYYVYTDLQNPSKTFEVPKPTPATIKVEIEEKVAAVEEVKKPKAKRKYGGKVKKEKK